MTLPHGPPYEDADVNSLLSTSTLRVRTEHIRSTLHVRTLSAHPFLVAEKDY